MKQQLNQQQRQNPKKKKMTRDHLVQNNEEERFHKDFHSDDPTNEKQRMFQELVNEVENEVEQGEGVADENTITTTTTTRRRTTATTSTPVDQTSQIVDEIAELCESILEAPQQAFSSSSSSSSSTTTSTTTDGSDTNSNKKKIKQRSSRDTGTSPISSSSTSKMDQLLHYASSSTVSLTSSASTNTKKDHSSFYDQDYIAQLAIMSLLVIYKDIVPSYRIRLPTAQEMAIKVSKEIQVLWDYERTLLRHYQQYITLLQSIWDIYNKSIKKSNNSSNNHGNINPKQSSLANTCILSMAELLKTTFHFNFRSNLLSAVIRQMNYKAGGGGESYCTNDKELHDLTTIDASRNSTIRTACCDTIQYIFMNDHQGDVTLEATRQISKYMKDRNYKNIHVQMLQTFYYIPLRVHVDEIMAVKIQQSINKKKRKRSDGNRELTTIENEMKEGSTTVDKVLLAQYQSDTLQVVILTYFRILKSIPAVSTTMDGSATPSSATKTPSSQKHIHDLLPTCLEGLAKFAHLINIDTVIDLLSVLRDLLQQQQQQTTTHETTIPVDATLNCILTAFQTLQGPGKEMKIDMKDYIVPLYNQIYRIVNFNESSYTKDGIIEMQSTSQKKKKGIVELLLQCLTMAFIQRREFSNVRLAAFTKQLLTVSLHCTRSDMTVPLLAFVRQLVHRYPASVLQQLFDNEQDVITQGQYRMDVSDPEHANPYATSAWECTLLQFHYNTKVQNQAINVATCKMLQLPSEEPLKLHIIERKQVNELYLPFVRQQKRHPLLISSNNKNEKNNNNRRVRFVTPRVKHCNLQNLR